jgi:hypothetical protein
MIIETMITTLIKNHLNKLNHIFTDKQKAEYIQVLKEEIKWRERRMELLRHVTNDDFVDALTKDDLEQLRLMGHISKKKDK